MLKWEKDIHNLHAILLGDSMEVPDELIIKTVEELNSTLQTNCDAAATYLFFAVAPICSSKPELSQKILCYPIRPLYYLGIDTPDGVILWLKGLLGNTSPYKALTTEGSLWIKNILITDKSLISNVIATVIESEASAT